MRSNLTHTFFYNNKSLELDKRFKNKLRTKPGLLSRRTSEQRLAVTYILLHVD